MSGWLSDHKPSWLLAGALIAVFVALGIGAARVESPTFDEPAHIAAGVSYIATGEVRANPQHPPLVKMLTGLVLVAAGLRLPEGPDTDAMLAGLGGEGRVGAALIAPRADWVMLRARVPVLLLATALGVLVFIWGREMVGNLAALAALLLFVLDPNVVAHSHLVTMDVALATLGFLFVWLLWRYIRQPVAGRLCLCGVVLGLLLATKYSALLFLPVSFVLLVAAVGWPPAPVTDTPAAFLRPYRMRTGRPVRDDNEDSIGGTAAAVGAFLAMCLLATIVIQLLYVSPAGLHSYWSGLREVNADHDPNYLVFMAGQVQHNFKSYFLGCYLLKEPIASLLLVMVGLVSVVRSREMSTLAKLCLLLPPAAIFAAHSIWADSLGVRYIIPALPFLCLVGGAGAAWLIRVLPTWGRSCVGLLAVWLAVGAFGIYPDQLSYFNEAACLGGHWTKIGLDGGSRCGPLWLDDSNVDWGQGLRQLRRWMDENGKGRTLRLAYRGTVQAEVYGVSNERVTYEGLFKEPSAGLYAVSAHYVARVPAISGDDWLQRVEPVAIVGHAFYIYDLDANTRLSPR